MLQPKRRIQARSQDETLPQGFSSTDIVKLTILVF